MALLSAEPSILNWEVSWEDIKMFKEKSIYACGFITIILLFQMACIDSSKEDENESSSIEVITEDLNFYPHFVNLETQSSDINTYDVRFFFGPYLIQGTNYGSYFVGLNQAAVVKAALDSLHDFENAELPITWCTDADCPPYDNPGLEIDEYDNTDELDSTHYAIGANWADLSSYGSLPNHGIASFDSTVYFIYTVDYEWVKFAVHWADPDSFSIQYALQNSDGSFGETHEMMVGGYTTLAYYNYVYLDFSTGEVIEPDDWHVGYTASPVYSEELQSIQYVPYVLFNSDLGVRVGIINDIEFDDLNSVPSDISWLDTPGDFIQFGYEGEHEILVYHPEPPYNHKVIVENPENVYIIDTGNEMFKLTFPNEDSYASGILQYIYEIIQ